MLTRGNTPGKKRNQELNGGVPKGWQRVTQVIRREPQYPESIKLYALISTWYEADIIGATIRNCFEQGCDRVYLLDNASPDDTVQIARKAGVEQVCVHSYSTEVYDDDLRITLQNAIIRDVTEREKNKYLWWVVLDGDEFPVAPHGCSLDDFLLHQPLDVRIIGSNFIDLYPTSESQYVQSAHPARCFSHGVWRRGGIQRYCQCGHWKHSVLRYDDGVYDMALFRGNHGVAVPGRASFVEPENGLVYFHAPLRNRADAEKRLSALCGGGRDAWDKDVTNNNGAVRRWQSLDAIYSQRWHEVELPHTQIFGRPVTGLALYPWAKLLPENFRFPYLQAV